MAVHDVEIGMLGSFTLLAGGEPVTLRSKKQRMILAALALAGGEVVSRDALVDGLWPDGAPDSVDTTLNSYISGLRRAIEPGLDRAGNSMLETKGLGYRLDPTNVRVDVHRCEQLASEGDIDAALQLVRGEPLADFVYDGFFDAEVARLGEQVLMLREQSLERALDNGDHRGVLNEISSLVEQYPLREHLRALLMTALYRCGRQADALAAFRAGREILLEELGLEPGPELTDLEQRVLQQDPALMNFTRVRATPVTKPTETAQTLPVFGRERELAILRNNAQESLAAGRVVLIGAEAGMGKTTLMRAIVDACRAEKRIICTAAAAPGHRHYDVWARAILGAMGDDPSASLALLPPGLVEPVLRMIPQAAALLGLEEPEPIVDYATAVALTETMVETGRHFLSAGPVICALDDLHDADPASLAYFTRLSLAAQEMPGLFLVGTYRENEIANRPELREMLARITGRAGVTRLTLEGIDAEHAQAWLSDRGSSIDSFTVGQLVARTGGNPLFIAELARSAEAHGVDLRGEIPVSDAVGDAIRARLVDLDPEVIEVLEVASLAESSISPEVDAAVLGRSVDDVDDAYDIAIEAGLFEDDPDNPGNMRFAHRVIADAIYASIGPRRRARLHTAVGRAVEDDAGDKAHRYAGMLARHYELGARSRDDAIRWLRVATDQAMASFDYRQAFDYGLRAMELLELEADSGPAADQVRLDLAMNAKRTGELEVAREQFLRAYADARASGDLERQARVATAFNTNAGTADARTWWSPGTVAHEALEETIADFGDDGAPDIRANLLARRACDGRDLAPERRDELASQAEELLTAHGLDDLALDLSGTLLLARWDSLDPEQLRRRADDAARAAEAAGRPAVELEQRRWAAGFTTSLGDLAEANERAEKLFRRGELLGLPPTFSGAFAIIPMLRTLEADFSGAFESFERSSQAVLPGSGAAETRALALLVSAWHQDLLTADMIDTNSDSGTGIPSTMVSLRAMVLGAAGDLDEAAKVLDAFPIDTFREPRGPIDWGLMGCALACAGAYVRSPAHLEIALDQLDRIAGQVAIPGPAMGTVGGIDTYRARALIALERHEDARAAIHASRTLADQLGPGIIDLETTEVAAMLASSEGRTADAEVLWRKLRDDAGAVGAHRLITLANRQLD